MSRGSRGAWLPVSARATFLACAGLLALGCRESASSDTAFGFRVWYVTPDDSDSESEWVGCDLADLPIDWRWSEGPHQGFGLRPPAELARESLAWFEGSPEVARHRRDRQARLELVYPSRALTITVRHVPDGELSWEAQLRAWFARFPPTEAARSEEPDSGHGWGISFGAHGELRGEAGSEPEALASMRGLVASTALDAPLTPSAFHLSSRVRRSPHEWDVYGAEVDSVARLDELPVSVRGKREEHERRR